MKDANRISSFILCIILLANTLCACTKPTDRGSIPAAVSITFSDHTVTASGAGARAEDGIVTITAGGSYIISGQTSEGRIIVDAPKQEVTLILNNADITCSYGSPIYIYQSSLTTIRLEHDTANTLTDGSSYTFSDGFSSSADDEPNACLYSKCDLVIEGSGSLFVNANYNNGITSKDTLQIKSASVVVAAVKHGINGKDSCTLTEADIQVTCEGDALRSTDGDLIVCGGTYMISAGDDGIHAEGTVRIMEGTITINESYEGIEGCSVDISGGTIIIRATDDGINAAGGETSSQAQNDLHGSSDCQINISGGFIEVDASGDGIDSNGDITISGGELYISGPISDGDSAIDYEKAATITGGIVIAAGSRGMAQNFGNDSTQGSILLTYPTSSTGAVSLKDASDNILAEYTPNTPYSSVVISCPSIVSGGSYTVTACEQTSSITMEGLIYGNPGMDAPPDGMGTPPDGTGTPPDDMDTPPNGIGTPPDGMGTPPDGMGTPPDGIGAPPDGIDNPVKPNSN